MLMSAPYMGMKRATAIPTIHLKRLEIDSLNVSLRGEMCVSAL